MLRKIFIFLFLVISACAFSQVDSLKHLAFSKKSDTAKAECYIKIAKSYYNNEGLLDSSLLYYNKAATIYKNNNLSGKYAKALNGKALIYREKGLYKEAMDNSLQALSIAENVKDTSQITASYNGIAIINEIQKDYAKAYEYYKKCEAIQLIIHSTGGLASTYNNLGLLFSEKKEPAKSLDYFEKALKYNEENKNERGIATACENIGLHYLEYDKDAVSALNHFHRSVGIWRKMKDINSVAITLDYIVSALMTENKYKECLDTANLSLKLATQAGSIFSIKQAHEKLYMIYEKLNDIPDAHTHYKQFIVFRDSLKNDDQLREITQMQMTYEFDKQREVEKLKQELKQNELSDKISKQKNIIFYFIIILLIVLISGVFVWRSYRINKAARKRIAFQNNLLEEQNKNIVDSIKYAKHIQEAILPPNEILKELLPENFIVYKPKDIVSGDFYWVKEKDEKIYIAVVDCTGHGVPGAFMSIVGRNGLTEALNNLIDPTAAGILDFLNDYVNDTLNQTIEHSTIRDGMDIALCVIDKKNKSVQYAGANNPLWIIRSAPISGEEEKTPYGNDKRGVEYKPDKQPIGNFIGDVSVPFSYKDIQFNKGDIFYLFTDGFADQFGGEKGKKFKYRQLYEKLLAIHQESMESQKCILDKIFDDWKGNLEQIDDVCIIGLRL
ncbi:MAG: tetratricopeptide repeat protein [Bacteroidia bacterium]